MLKRANEDESQWNSLLEKYAETYPELAEEFKLAISGKLPKNYKDELPRFELGHNGASRADSGTVIQAISKLSLHSLVDQQTLLVQTNPM